MYVYKTISEILRIVFLFIKKKTRITTIQMASEKTNKKYNKESSSYTRIEIIFTNERIFKA